VTHFASPGCLWTPLAVPAVVYTRSVGCRTAECVTRQVGVVCSETRLGSPRSTLNSTPAQFTHHTTHRHYSRVCVPHTHANRFAFSCSSDI